MFKRITLAIVGALAAIGASAASSPDVPTASAAIVGGPTSIPYGWVDFCGREPDECALGTLKPVDIVLTKKTLAILDEVNRRANAAIQPVSNLEHWGTMLDHWDYPLDGRGDCKVYALYKRKLLIERGFPRQALLMTIVHDLEGQGHAILTVKTDHGDFVLDNLSDEIRAWDATGYTFLKRQAQDDPNVWLAIGAEAAEAATASLKR